MSPTTATTRGASSSFSAARCERYARMDSAPAALLTSAFSLAFALVLSSAAAGKKADEERKSSVGCCVLRYASHDVAVSRGTVSMYWRALENRASHTRG